MKLQWPTDIDKYHISQYFGQNLADFYAQMGYLGHQGCDIACPTGTPIYAAHDGVVISPDNGQQSDTAGRGVKIWDKEQKILTLYFHLKETLVNRDQVVKAGDLIAYSDNTGTMTYGAHLHFALYLLDENGNTLNQNNGYGGAVDPIPYLIEIPVEGSLIKNASEAPVYVIKNGQRWWIQNEKTFLDYFGYPVNQANIITVGILVTNTVTYGGIITNEK